MRRPIIPVALGLLGLIPFVGSAVGLDRLPPLLTPFAFYVLKVYALLILAFLGGVHWGRALSSGKALSFIWSVIPSLIGLGAALLPPEEMFLAFAGAFALAGLVDVVVFARGGPRWYAWLRVVLTLIVGGVMAYSATQAGGWVVDPYGTFG